MVKKIHIKGLLLPKDKISRNGVLYDWESIKASYKELIGLPLLYNHLNEGAEKPIGKFIDSWVKEKSDSEGIAGWYYKADLNPNSEYIDSILRGDISKVSVQVITNKQKKEELSDGRVYTRAYISEILEASAVPTPGFNETSIEVEMQERGKSEKFKGEILSEGFGIHQDKEDEVEKMAYVESTRDVVIRINGKKKILTLSGSDIKAVDEEGNEWIKQYGRWLPKENVSEEEEDNEKLLLNRNSNINKKEVSKMKDDKQDYEIIKEQEDSIQKIVDILENIESRLSALENSKEEVTDMGEEPEEPSDEEEPEIETEEEEPEKKKEQEEEEEPEKKKEQEEEPEKKKEQEEEPEKKKEQEEEPEKKKEQEEEPEKKKEQEEGEEPKKKGNEELPEGVNEETEDDDDKKSEEVEEDTSEEPQEEDDEDEEEEPKPPVKEKLRLRDIRVKSSFHDEGFKEAVKNLLK